MKIVFSVMLKRCQICVSQIYITSKRGFHQHTSPYHAETERFLMKKKGKKHFKITDGFPHQMLHFNLGRNALLRT